MSLSIVIPVYEDREECLEVVHRLVHFGEIIVVDASRDDQLAAEELPHEVTLIRSEKAQRAHQMNLGAASASGDCLLFLHADTKIPDESFHSLEKILSDLQVVGGGFARRFSSKSMLLALTCRLADWRGRMWGLFFGDQAIFARRSSFEEIGGFRVMDLFEDFDLCRRLRKMGAMRCVTPPIISSDRRFRAGVVPRVWKDFLLTVDYFLGRKDDYSEE